MRVFKHPNLINFKCPICGTSEDKEVVLIGKDGTEEGKIIECEQVHLECLELRITQRPEEPGKIIYQVI
jgi:hypothetical protein